MGSIFNNQNFTAFVQNEHTIPLMNLSLDTGNDFVTYIPDSIGLNEETETGYSGQDVDISQTIDHADTDNKPDLIQCTDPAWNFFSQANLPELSEDSHTYRQISEENLHSYRYVGQEDSIILRRDNATDIARPDVQGVETTNDDLISPWLSDGAPSLITDGAVPHPYDLRPGFRDLNNASSTWLDKDKSGDYDPNVKAPQAIRRRQRQCSDSLHTFAYGEDSSTEPQRHRKSQAMSELAARQTGASHIITLKLNSREGQALLAIGVNHWPFEDPTNTRNDSFFDLSATGSYTLRSRASGPMPRYEPDTDRPDLTGQPLARGCWSCHDLGMGMDCSLLHNSIEWPCHTCSHDKNECELITPAKIKKSCGNCKGRKIQCSYTTSSDHSMPCTACQESGFYCIAGPNRAAIRPRISYDNPLHNQPQSCITLDEEALSAPDNESQPYEPHKPRGGIKRKRIAHEAETLNDTHEAGRSHEATEPSSPASTLSTIITTRLSHPVQFNHEDPTQQQECHFCTLPHYAIFGLGQRTISVTETPKGLSELSASNIQEPTRLCISHTMHSIRALICKPHLMRRIPSSQISINSTCFRAAFERLVSGTSLPTELWCSVCPAPASHECANAHEKLKRQGGCGLQLCERCAEGLEDTHKGDLGSFMAGLRDEVTNERPLGLRADVELLRGSGPLATWMIRMATA